MFAWYTQYSIKQYTKSPKLAFVEPFMLCLILGCIIKSIFSISFDNNIGLVLTSGILAILSFINAKRAANK